MKNSIDVSTNIYTRIQYQDSIVKITKCAFFNGQSSGITVSGEKSELIISESSFIGIKATERTAIVAFSGNKMVFQRCCFLNVQCGLSLVSGYSNLVDLNNSLALNSTIIAYPQSETYLMHFRSSSCKIMFLNNTKAAFGYKEGIMIDVNYATGSNMSFIMISNVSCLCLLEWYSNCNNVYTIEKSCFLYNSFSAYNLISLSSESEIQIYHSVFYQENNKPIFSLNGIIKLYNCSLSSSIDARTTIIFDQQTKWNENSRNISNFPTNDDSTCILLAMESKSNFSKYIIIATSSVAIVAICAFILYPNRKGPKYDDIAERSEYQIQLP